MKRLAFIAFSCILLASCAGTPLKVVQLQSIPEKREPLFTLIYFVGTERYDVRRAVILDLEGDGYEFRPEVKDFEYEILQSISIPESLYEAEVFFQHQGIRGYSKSAILLPGGKVAGYELRPLYKKEFMGIKDLLKTSYYLDSKSGHIKIRISLRASLKRLVY